MVDNIAGKTGAVPGAPIGAKAQGPAAGADPLAAGAAFQALLEKLETHARELEAQSKSIESPKDLNGAVDRAHASLQDALSIRDRLVEAYREALARTKAPGAKP
jgi:flagellar hook-basal body complex protein FliE